MKYEAEFIDRDYYYSVGVDLSTGEYIMEVVITHIAWYSRYFSLSENEVSKFKEDNTSLRNLAKSFGAPGAVKAYAERLVNSQNTQENLLRDQYLSQKS